MLLVIPRWGYWTLLVRLREFRGCIVALLPPPYRILDEIVKKDPGTGGDENGDKGINH